MGATPYRRAKHAGPKAQRAQELHLQSMAGVRRIKYEDLGSGNMPLQVGANAPARQAGRRGPGRPCGWPTPTGGGVLVAVIACNAWFATTTAYEQ